MKREEAYELLHKYMKGENYIQHSMAVEAIMRGLAKRLAPEDVEYWGASPAFCTTLMRSSATGATTRRYTAPPA